MLENTRKKCHIWPFFWLKHEATFGSRSNFWPIKAKKNPSIWVNICPIFRIKIEAMLEILENAGNARKMLEMLEMLSKICKIWPILAIFNVKVT